MATFSKSEAVRYGFQTATKNLWFFVLLLLIVVVVNFLPGFLSSRFEGQAAIIGFLITILGWGLQITISLGLIGIALRIHDKKKAEYKNLFDYLPIILSYIFASIIYGLIVVVGFILFIIPGVIWAIKFRYYDYFMVDKNMGPIEALKASSKVTQGNKWNLFLFGLVLGVINILGALILFIGLFVTIPLTMMAEAHVFRKLSGSK